MKKPSSNSDLQDYIVLDPAGGESVPFVRLEGFSRLMIELAEHADGLGFKNRRLDLAFALVLMAHTIVRYKTEHPHELIAAMLRRIEQWPDLVSNQDVQDLVGGAPEPERGGDDPAPDPGHRAQHRADRA